MGKRHGGRQNHACVYLETSSNASLHPREREETKPTRRAAYETGKGVVTLKEFQTATDNGKYLTREKTALSSGQLENFLGNTNGLSPGDHQALTRIWQVRGELRICTRGLIMKGNSIRLPKTLWGRMVDLAHQGYPVAAAI